jgi:transposase
MTCYAGLDVSLRSTNICVVDQQGEVIVESKTDAEVIDIVGFLDGLEIESVEVGLEAGTLAQYLTYGLRFAGYEVVCLEARQVKAALSAMRNKTDKNDARGIAQLLRSGWYSSVHIKSMESHRVRALLASRRALLDKCVDLENEIRGILKVFGVKLPPKLGHGAFDRVTRSLVGADETLSTSLLPVLDARLSLYNNYRDLDNRTRHLAEQDPVCRRLMTAPGVGYITALTFKSGVDDPTRFRRSRTVAAHFGLTPRRFQSGEVDFDGHISRCGDPSVRSALYTAANALLTRSSKWSPLKAWGMKLAKSRGHKKAVIAVARKLAVVLHRMWIDDTQFQWGTEAARS